MSRKLRIRALLGLMAMVVLFVGVLVWPEPKEAKADTAITVDIHDGLNGVTNLDPEPFIYLYDGASVYQEGPMVEIGGGVYKWITQGIPGQDYDCWDVTLSNQDCFDIVPVDPNTNPCPLQDFTITYLDWEVELIATR
jgi:hypothetical protein